MNTLTKFLQTDICRSDKSKQASKEQIKELRSEWKKQEDKRIT